MNYPITIFAKGYGAVDSRLLHNLESKFSDLKFSPYVRSQGAIKVGGNLNAGVIYGIDFRREMSVNRVLNSSVKSLNLSQAVGGNGGNVVNLSQNSENLGANSGSQSTNGKNVSESPAINGEDSQAAQIAQKSSQNTENSSETTANAIILGERLVRDSALNLDSKVTVIFTQLQAGGMSLIPTMKRFNLEGIFNSGLSSYDTSYMYVDIATLQKIRGFESDIYDGIHVFSKNPMSDIEALKNYLARDVGVVGWWEQNGNFFSAIALEKRALFIVLMLIIIMASLNIISSLMMVIMTRRREIALLLSLGASKRDIKKTFFWLGNAIGFGGIIFGLILASIALWALGTFPIISLPADVYGSSKLPLHISFIDIISTIFGAILVVLASSYYPSLRASEINPLSTLRSE
ncbi:hypothetical protein CCY99_08140 [Helicobacter sp. 16-1353]|nr:hypothetical protein CCY99_08140 [Helicobacter sp. 16-1353]